MNSTVERSIPVFGALVLVLDSIDEVVCVLLAHLLDFKIVDDEAEGDRARLVLPEAWHVSAGGITILCEVLFEFNPCYVSSSGIRHFMNYHSCSQGANWRSVEVEDSVELLFR